MLHRTLTIIQSGAVSYAVCPRCNSRLESKYLVLVRATEEIRRKEQSHVCRPVDVLMPLRDEPSKILPLRPDFRQPILPA